MAIIITSRMMSYLQMQAKDKPFTNDPKRSYRQYAKGNECTPNKDKSIKAPRPSLMQTQFTDQTGCKSEWDEKTIQRENWQAYRVYFFELRFEL